MSVRVMGCSCACHLPVPVLQAAASTLPTPPPPLFDSHRSHDWNEPSASGTLKCDGQRQERVLQAAARWGRAFSL